MAGDPKNAANAKRLRVDSDALLQGLQEMKSMEKRKRQEEISTPRFHELADDIERQARKVYDLALGEAELDDQTETIGQSIDETPPDQSGSRNPVRATPRRTPAA